MKITKGIIEKVLDFQYIIVASIFQKRLEWFISDKEDWFLDYRKWPDSFGGPDVQYFRSLIPVVDFETFPKFRNHLQQSIYSTEEIQKFVLPYFQKPDWRDYPELFPAIYVNFDSKILRSVVVEGTPFEEFAPPQWDSQFGMFLGSIPVEDRYWVDGGQDFSEKMYPTI